MAEYALLNSNPAPKKPAKIPDKPKPIDSSLAASDIVEGVRMQVSLESKMKLNEKSVEDHELITRIPFFENMDFKAMRKLSKVFERKVYEKDAIVVQEGKQHEGFHVIVTGRVRLTAHAEDGKEYELHALEKGDYFGDIVLVQQHALEPVTVRALEKSVILSITAANFKLFCKENPTLSVSVEHENFKLQLKSIPFFSEVSEVKLQQLGVLFELKRCSEGTLICKQGDEAKGFYIIVSGRINVSAAGPTGGVHLNTLTKGDWFGEIALLQNALRTATLTTVQPCLLLYLSTERFQTFLKLAPEIRSERFLNTITRRTANSLKAIPIFDFLQRKQIGPLQTFDERKLGLLGELFRFITFPENTVVFREGSVGDAFYIIVRGSVITTCKSQDPADIDPASGGSASGPRGATAASGTSGGGGGGGGRRETVVQLSELEKNDFFGEIALLNNTRRTATVTTKTSCLFLKLLSHDFQRFLEIAPSLRATFERVVSVRTAQTLEKIPFFKSEVRENKPWSKLGILGSMFQYESCTTGSVVCREGEVGNKFYVIVDGMVEVVKQIYTDRGEEIEFVIDVLTKGSWFGEIALMKEAPRMASVKCKENCLFLTVTKERFHKFLRIEPGIWQHFSSLVTHRTANMLKTIDFFHLNIIENKPWSKLELLSSLFTYESYDAKTVVIREGDVSKSTNKFFVIALGAVELSRLSPGKDKDGKPLPFVPGAGGAAPAGADSKSIIDFHQVNKLADTLAANPLINKHAAATAAAPKPDEKSAPLPAASAAGLAAATVPTSHLDTKHAPGSSGSLEPATAAAVASSSAPSHHLHHSSSSSGVGIGTPSPRHGSGHYDTHSASGNPVLRAGSYFGDIALLDTVPRPLTVTTLEPCVFFTLAREKFEQFLKVAPEMKTKFQFNGTSISSMSSYFKAATPAESHAVKTAAGPLPPDLARRASTSTSVASQSPSHHHASKASGSDMPAAPPAFGDHKSSSNDVSSIHVQLNTTTGSGNGDRTPLLDSHRLMASSAVLTATGMSAFVGAPAVNPAAGTSMTGVVPKH